MFRIALTAAALLVAGPALAQQTTPEKPGATPKSPPAAKTEKPAAKPDTSTAKADPKTGAKVEVPPKKIPYFKPSKELKDFVNSEAAGAAAPVAPGGAPQD